MDIQQLRYFVEVAQELHFGRAADRLHITPSPLSRRIRELERELGVELYVRGYHDVQLTEAGQLLLDPARDVLQRFDALKALVRAQASSARPGLHVGASPLTPPHSLDVLLDTMRSVDARMAGPVVLEPTAQLLPPSDELRTGCRGRSSAGRRAGCVQHAGDGVHLGRRAAG